MTSSPDTTGNDNLAFYRLRDQFVREHKPMGEFEMLLVMQMCQCFLRLQRAQETERRYFEQNDILEVINTKLTTFKAITRYVTDAERGWRQACMALKQAQRRRDLSSPNARRSYTREVLDNLPPARPKPRVEVAAAESNASRRE